MDASRLGYKPGWTFKVAGPGGRFLCVFATTPDSNDPARNRTTQHQFELPEGLDDRAMARWVFDRLLECEQHEVGEFFRWDGRRPFMPNHADEGSPYARVERWDDAAARS
jgi:hypothetical protein